jgi:hypothetical protein
MAAGNLQDLVTEEVAYKSGLLLTNSLAATLLLRRDHPESRIFTRDPDSAVRYRPEDIDAVINHLRHAVGDLPDLVPPIVKRIRWFKKLQEQGIDPLSDL